MPLPDSQISQLFRIFKSEYGSAFTHQYAGDDMEKDIALAKALWAKRLHDCTQAEIGYGLAEIGDRYKKYPPNVHEFHDLCKSYKPMKQAHELWKGLEHKDGEIIDKETVNKDMADLRRMLGMKQKPETKND